LIPERVCPTRNTAENLVASGYHERRRASRLRDPEFRAEYETASAEIAQIDAVLRTLDELREEAGLSKAEIARRIGKNPASVRRLFTAQANPELKTIVSLAHALHAEVEIVPRRKKPARSKRNRPTRG
jgi:DNA-binding XRE family transcriptional regulator